ncbi:MAG: EAL domain-containing protein [Ignavibacteriales bacterium]|nr:EAL domain-containing protein [Ignavibacteriales bacterium]
MFCKQNFQKRRAIIHSVAALTKETNFKIIAEGVEIIQQEIFLKSCGIHYIQGYLYSKPLCVDDFINFITKMNSINEN